MIFTFLLTFISSEPEVKTISELHVQEIAIEGSFLLKEKTGSSFTSCIPQESKVFTGEFPEEIQKSIFRPSELNALMKCSHHNCAFNFLFPELQSLEALKTEEERKKAYLQFFKNRMIGKTVPFAPQTTLWIRSQEKAFSFCDSSEFSKLLDERPLKKYPYRFQHAQYQSRMRPTTRLTQGLFFENNTCYAEVLIFSDHYDGERVEIWQAKSVPEGLKIRVQIRHRLDFLTSWFRRLNKSSLRDALKEQIKKQLDQVKNCLQ